MTHGDAIFRTLRCRSSLEGVCESVQGTRWGADEDSTSRARVLETVSLAAREQLKETEVGAVEGDWELLWTTEASVHSIIRATASFAPVHRVTQCINFTCVSEWLDPIVCVPTAHCAPSTMQLSTGQRPCMMSCHTFA